MKKIFGKILEKIIQLTERQRLVLLAILVGLCSGLAAVILKTGVRYVSLLLDRITIDKYNFMYLVFPGIGMLISMLIVKYVVKENLSHGITKVLYAISRKKSRLSSKTIWGPLVTSIITIGFGGSVGAEAPIVHSGASIGSYIAQKFKLSYHQITLLLVCGAAGSIAGIFKAPLAGIIFSIEILMFDFSLSSITPLLLSSVTAICISYFLIGNDMPFAASVTAFQMSNIPYYIILGVLCGLLSLYFIKVSLWLEAKIGGIENPYRKLLICAVFLGVIIFVFPPLYGEGYSSLALMLNNDVDSSFAHTFYSSFASNSGWFVLVFWVFVMLAKVFSMSLTNAGGGVGGTFGPTLVIGGICGFVLSRFFNLTGWISLPEANFALAGMGGLMAGVMHAPMTGIFLIAEITGGYELIIPLIITVSLSYLITNSKEKHSIYTKRLAMVGDLLTHDKDKAVLTLLDVKQLLETDLDKVYPADSLRYLVEVVSTSHRNLYPVVDRNGKYQGLVTLDDIRSIMFDNTKYDTVFVKDLMHADSERIVITDSMETVMEKFTKSNAWNLAVVDENGKYLGMVSKSKIFSAYREQLIEVSEA